MVDTHPADPVLHLGDFHRLSDDHLRVDTKLPLSPSGLENPSLLRKIGKKPFQLSRQLTLIIRFSQLALAGDVKYLFSSGLMSLLFWLEIVVGSAIPIDPLFIQAYPPKPERNC